MGYTNTDLVATIKQRAMLPSSQSTWTTARILSLATELLQTEVMGTMISIREEYFVTSADTTIVTGTYTYPINKRAVGMSLRDLFYVNSSGDVVNVSMIPADNRGQHRNDTTSKSMGFYIQWNDLVVTSTPAGSLRQVFQILPGELVETSACGLITDIDTGTFTVTLSDTPPSTMVADVAIDFIAAEGGHEHRAIDQSITSVSGNDLVFTSLPSTLAVGDWVALSGESPVAQVADSLQPWLAQKAVVQILESLGDKKWEAAAAKLAKLEESVIQIISPRVKGEAKVIIPRSGGRGFYI